MAIDVPNTAPEKDNWFYHRRMILIRDILSLSDDNIIVVLWESFTTLFIHNKFAHPMGVSALSWCDGITSRTAIWGSEA